MERGEREQLLLTTKFTIPPVYLKNIILRERLHKKLDEGLNYSCILIAAPSGYGKTTLVSEWIRQTEMSATWLSLDERDNDPVRFWRYTLTALSTLRKQEIDQMLSEWLKSQSFLNNNEDIITPLINTFTTLEEDIVLVLDEYDVITNPVIHKEVSFLLEHLPPRMHVILITRSDPPLPLARLRVLGQLLEFRASDLSFTLRETNIFLEHVLNFPLPLENITELQQRTEGWAAALRLAAQYLQTYQDPDSIKTAIQSFTGTNRHIFHYIVEEVLARVPEHIHTFLLYTSVLDRFTADLCDAVTIQTRSREMIEWLEQANLFINSLDEKREWYRYHQLFADLLRYLLRQQHPELLPELHNRASHWYEQQELIGDAIAHAFAAQNLERAAKLVEDQAWLLVRRGETRMVSTWLKRLPARIIENHPLLAHIQATVFLLSDRIEDYARLIKFAEQGWQNEKNQMMLSRIYDNHAYLAHITGDGPNALLYSQKALELAVKDDLQVQGSAGVALGVGFYLMGELFRAQEELSRGYTLCTQSYQVIVMIIASIYLAQIQVERGLLNDAEQAYLHILPNESLNTLAYRSMIHLKLCQIYYEWNELDMAQTQWEEALQLEQKHQGSLFLGNGYLLAAQLARARGEQERVLQYLHAAEHMAQRFGGQQFMQLQSIAFRVQDAIMHNNQEAIRQWKEYHHPQEFQSVYEQETWNIIQGQLLIAQGNATAAISLLEKDYQKAQEQQRVNSMVHLLLQLVLAHRANGNQHQAIQLLEKTLQLSRAGNYIRSFVDMGPQLGTLLFDYLQRQNKKSGKRTSLVCSPEYIRKILLAMEPETQSMEVILTPEQSLSTVERLSEREAHVLTLIAEGLSNQEIARRLMVTMSTIKTHLNNIYAKLGVHTRLQAVTRAHELGLLRRFETETEPLSGSSDTSRS